MRKKTTVATRRLGRGIVLVGAALWAVTAAAVEPVTLARYEFQAPQMGVLFRIVLYAESADAANQAAQAAFARVAELNGRLSDYLPESELNRLSQTSGQGRKVPVSCDLGRVLVAGQELAQRSEGAFDVTVGPYVQLWRVARRTGKLPTPEQLAEARTTVGYRALRFSTEGQGHVELERPKMRLDLGGIAKGFAADEALNMLRKHGITRAMVAASGDMALGDPPPGRAGWRIDVAPLAENAPPSRRLSLARQGVATSGDAFQYIEINGQRYSHLVDPHTGLGLTTRSSATVVAPTAMAADSLASALSVLGPERGLKLVAEYPETEALFVQQVDGETKTFESEGLKQYEAAPPTSAPIKSSSPQAAPEKR